MNAVLLGRNKNIILLPALYTKSSFLVKVVTPIVTQKQIDRTFVTNSLVRLFKLTTDIDALKCNYNRTITQNNVFPLNTIP